MTPERRKNLDRLFNPRHIAFVGGIDAAVAIGEAQRIGYQGQYWPVNPKRGTLKGIPCFKRLEDLPEPPDAVYLAIPAKAAIDTLRQLDEMGAGGVACYSAGFGEAGSAGKKAEQALIAANGDLALIGPNCYGVINYLDKVALWPFAHGGWSPGYGCAVITQSGMLSSDLTMGQRSLPLTHMISLGNQTIISMEDLIDYLCADDRVRAIGLHIEGLKDVSEFARAVAKATRLGKPVVALKTGSSAIGKSLTQSHTGSISGEDDLFDALFKRVGVIRVHSPAQLVETLKFVSVAGAPKGKQISGFTCSGGGATMLADHGEKIGLSFPPFEKGRIERLAKILPDIATVSNPLDYTTPIWGQAELTEPVFREALEYGFDASILVQDYPAAGLDETLPAYTADSEAFRSALEGLGIPAGICSTLPENMDEETRKRLIGYGIAPMQGINEALEAINDAANWNQIREQLTAELPGDLLPAPDGVKTWRATDEISAKQQLAQFGLDVPEMVTGCEAEIGGKAKSLTFPAVLKLAHPDLLHKSDVGAVQLGLKNATELDSAASDMQRNVNSKLPGLKADQFLVEEMQPSPLAEMIVSLRWDSQFGLVMTLGAGGILVELVDDAVSLLWPASNEDIKRSISSLKIAKLLNGFRGKPAADLDGLANTLHQLAKFMLANEGKVHELEINPLFVYQNRSVIVDALMHVVD